MFSMFSSKKPAAEIVSGAQAGEIVVIDIREPAEIASSGAAKGALRIPLSTLRMRVDPTSPECAPELKRTKTVALYCASGARSSMAKRMMKQMGYTDVHNLGSLQDWHAGGGAIAR